MTKSIKSFVSLCAIYLGTVSMAYAEPAIILTDFGCGLLDGNGDGLFTTDTKIVNSLNQAGGNVNMKCYASDVPNDSGETVKWDFYNFPRPCGTQYGATEDWRIVVDPDGNATMTCKIHFNDN